MIDQRNPRSYIGRLQRDPRMRALFDSWIVQATIIVRERYGEPMSAIEAQRMATETAEEAVQLAMSFVLDNDGEYQAVRRELDECLQRSIALLETQPSRMVIATPEN